MSDAMMDTVRLHDWLDRMRDGDRVAREELLRAVCGRLERLARKMLGRFPAVGRWVQTEDVLQNALLRLLRALEQVRPTSTRAFFGLAGEQIRRELLDLARHFYGPEGYGANHCGGARVPEPADCRDDRAELERWREFHEMVERLPAEEREVVGLVYYHGWTQAQVADLFQVSDRTVRRRWESALLRMHEALRAEAYGM